MGLERQVVEGGDGWLRVVLAGSLDEEADYAAAFADLSGRIVLDLAAIERANSLGIHRWIPRITMLAAQGQLVIERLSYPLAVQANFVSNLFAGAEVRSCLAPYYCPLCQRARQQLVAREEAALAAGAPARSCHECQSPLELDELEGFFAFFGARSSP